MTTQYGSPIPVNGKRPEWLRKGVVFQFALGDPSDWTESAGSGWTSDHWTVVTAVRLPIDHPYYARTGMLASKPEPVCSAPNRFNAGGEHSPVADASEPTGDVMAAYNSRTHATVPKMTEAEALAWVGSNSYIEHRVGIMHAFKVMGIIRPDHDPIEAFAAKHGLSEPATAELRDMLGEVK